MSLFLLYYIHKSNDKLTTYTGLTYEQKYTEQHYYNGKFNPVVFYACWWQAHLHLHCESWNTQHKF